MKLHHTAATILLSWTLVINIPRAPAPETKTGFPTKQECEQAAAKWRANFETQVKEGTIRTDTDRRRRLARAIPSTKCIEDTKIPPVNPQTPASGTSPTKYCVNCGVREAKPVNNVRWRIAGDEVVSCNCAWGCPCQFNALPTTGRCEGVAAFEIHEGHFGEVGLDGVRFARIYSWPASIPEGNGTRLTIIDDRAAADQRAALVALDSAKHGGLYFEIFASVCPNLLEPIFAPLEIAINRGKRRAQVMIPDVLETRVEPITSVSGKPYRARIVLPDGFEFKKAEMGNTVRFEVKTPREVAMRHENSYAQLNAFDWSNQRRPGLPEFLRDRAKRTATWYVKYQVKLVSPGRHAGRFPYAYVSDPDGYVIELGEG